MLNAPGIRSTDQRFRSSESWPPKEENLCDADGSARLLSFYEPSERKARSTLVIYGTTSLKVPLGCIGKWFRGSGSEKSGALYRIGRKTVGFVG